MVTRVFVDPGLFRDRAVLEVPSVVPDGQGGAETAWSVLRAIWVHLEPRSAERAERFDRIEGEVRHRVLCRYAGDIERGQRFRLGARVLAIETAYDPDERGRYLLCLCTEEA